MYFSYLSLYIVGWRLFSLVGILFGWTFLPLNGYMDAVNDGAKEETDRIFLQIRMSKRLTDPV